MELNAFTSPKVSLVEIFWIVATNEKPGSFSLVPHPFFFSGFVYWAFWDLPLDNNDPTLRDGCLPIFLSGFLSVTPPCLGVTRRDHVSRPTMKTMILMMMMMINMSTQSIPAAPSNASFTLDQQSSSHPVSTVFGRC
jgi:hypothetical protein